MFCLWANGCRLSIQYIGQLINEVCKPLGFVFSERTISLNLQSFRKCREGCCAIS